jgi:hypothetical protein
VRPFLMIPLILPLAACGLPTPETYIVGAAAGLAAYSYRDEIGSEARKLSDTKAEEIPISNAVKDAVPPRVENLVNRVANNIRDNVKVTERHVKDWWNYEPEILPPHPVPDSYCYRTQTDVLCYRAPMPGWEHRLVGYQGTNAAPPPLAMMQPLPAKSVDEAMLPETRVNNAKPVFVEMPPEVKEEPKDSKEITPETAPENVHETIADPTLSPQL